MSEGHNSELPRPLASGKCHILFVFLIQCHLPVSAFQALYSESHSSSQRVQVVVDPWEQNAVFSDVILPSVVCSEAKAASIFRMSTTGNDQVFSDHSLIPLLFMSSSR